MNRAVRFIAVGLALGAILSGPATAHADSEARKYTHVLPNQRAVLSTSPIRIKSVQVGGGVGHADLIDSPDGTASNAQADWVHEQQNPTAGNTTSSGPIDRFTRYGCVVESSNVDVFVTWDDF